MICTHCLRAAPVLGGPTNALKAFRAGLTRAWRIALGKLGPLG